MDLQRQKKKKKIWFSVAEKAWQYVCAFEGVYLVEADMSLSDSVYAVRAKEASRILILTNRSQSGDLEDSDGILAFKNLSAASNAFAVVEVAKRGRMKFLVSCVCAYVL